MRSLIRKVASGRGGDRSIRDQFWIKSQPYSLLHVFNNSEIANAFAGGTIYQAFLSAMNYHRWHSPVSGKVLKTYVVDGSYYAADLNMGFDPESPNASQGFLPQVATRGVILIEADNPKIGTMAAVYIGMSEVSSNEFTVRVRNRRCLRVLGEQAF